MNKTQINPKTGVISTPPSPLEHCLGLHMPLTAIEACKTMGKPNIRATNLLACAHNGVPA